MIPQNEQGVVVLFAQQCQQAGYEILEISEAYPDGIIRKDDTDYKVEFEYNAKNFLAHNHDIRRCDLIVCWENDYPDCVLPVLELSNDQWSTQAISKVAADKKRIDYWKTRTLKAERENQSLKANLLLLKTANVQELNHARQVKIDQRRSQVKQMLQAGQAKQNIAETIGVSLKTIQRDIKAMSTNGQRAASVANGAGQ